MHPTCAPPSTEVVCTRRLFLIRYESKMKAPDIASSTREERLSFVQDQWKCLHNCELCGKCHILKGRSEEHLYAEYIEGKRSYMDITFEIRNNKRL